MEMHWPKLLIFFWLSINYTSIFPIMLSLSYVVKYDGSVYDVDVDEILSNSQSTQVKSLKNSLLQKFVPYSKRETGHLFATTARFL